METNHIYQAFIVVSIIIDRD